MKQTTKEAAQKLADIIKDSKKIVFFGGAGVSTESGIPDFRSEDGLFQAQQKFGYRPEELLSDQILNKQPKVFFQYASENLISDEAQPNKAHKALARLEKDGKLTAVVTQNIDGLHQKAGSKTVYELHGSVYRNYCVDCKTKYSLDYVLDEKNREDHIPRCSKCNGMVRPDVVMYGESLDDAVIQGALQALQQADLLIVGGTSLAVYPAAGMVQYFGGDNLVLINKTTTPLDKQASLVIHDSVGEVLGYAMEQLDKTN